MSKKYGDSLVWFLRDLAAHVEGFGDCPVSEGFEVVGETEDGIECDATIDIGELATEAANEIEYRELLTVPIETLDNIDYKQMRADLLELQQAVNASLKAIDGLLLDELIQGNDVDGFELGYGKSTRKWVSPSDAEKLLAEYLDDDELNTTKLNGIPAIEKALTAKGIKPAERQEILKQIVIEVPGKPVLVEKE